MRLSSLLVLTLTLLTLPRLQAQPTPKAVIQPQNSYQFYNESSRPTIEYKLENGLSVFITKNPNAPLVSVYHWVKAGSLHEKPGSTGIAHLFEHMMFRPLEKGQPGFFTLIRKYGADANANTRYPSTVYTTTTPAKYLKDILKHESDRFKKLKVTDELLDVERKAVWSEYSTKFDSNPMLDLWYAIYNSGFPNHPYRWTVIGFREDLDKIKATDCNQFFEKFYRPNNVGLFISGDVNPEEVIQNVSEAYGDWPKGADSSLPKSYEHKGDMIRVEGKLTSGARNLLGGYRIPEFTPENVHIMRVLNFIFFRSEYNLAERRMVHKTKRATGAGDFNFDYDTGLMSFLISLSPSTTYEAILDDVAALNADFKAMSDEEFKAYLKDYRISHSEGILRNESLNSALALNWGKHGSVQVLKEALTRENLVSRADLNSFVDKYFTKKNLIIAVNKGFK